MKILIFEDDKYDLLFPLTMLRAVYEVKPGALNLAEKLASALEKESGKFRFHCRTSLQPLMKLKKSDNVNEYFEDDYLLLNGRFVFRKRFLRKLMKEDFDGSFYKSGDSVAYALIPRSKSYILKERIPNSEGVIDEVFLLQGGLRSREAEPEFLRELRYPWDVISYMLEESLEDDLRQIASNPGKSRRLRNSKKESQIYCSAKANVAKSAVLDATEGKIVIEEGAVLEPFVFIKGPVYIGKNVLIKSGARIYGPCSIGKGSKVAGEIAESVFHSFVNKQHDGFTGHSYFCPFVNLGADTVTSDLKNNYSVISLKFRGGLIDTGMMFLGSIIGDHSKTSVNTMLNTGTIAGIFANIFGGGFPPKEIDSFSWNEAGRQAVRYDFDKAMKTAETVMSRRGIKLTNEYLELARYYYESGDFKGD